MAGFNPNSPTLLGLENQPTIKDLVRLDSSTKGAAMRFRSTGADTISHVHAYIQDIFGNPGIGIEILDVPVPTVTTTNYFPGTDAGASDTGWQDQAAGASDFGEIDDQFSTADYHTPTAATSRQSSKTNRHSGNNAGALAGKRVLRVTLSAHVHLRNLDTNDPSVLMFPQLFINGQVYEQASQSVTKSATPKQVAELGVWDFNPETGLPWTVGEADDLIDAADADNFGVRIRGKMAAQGFRIHGYWLTIHTCTENRKGFYYAGGQPFTGWGEYALSSTSALANNTSYFLLIYPLKGGAADYMRIPRLTDPAVVLDTAMAGTGEHRTAYNVALYSQGGSIETSTESSRGLLPALLDSAGTIRAYSQPYADIAEVAIDSSVSNAGQQVTAAAGTTYQAIMLTVGWVDPLRRPDASLVIEVRETTIGGTLRGTATLKPVATQTGYNQEFVAIDTPFASTAVQYWLVCTSNATPGRGWKLGVLDSKSNTIGSGTTLAEIEGATQGGQTDSYFAASVAADRFDVPIALSALPTAISSLTATVQVGSTGVPPGVKLTWPASALGANFGGYRIWRRPSRAQVERWQLVGAITVPTGYTAAVVEANHNVWFDYAAGWGADDGPYIDGWDYAVSSYNRVTGTFSEKETVFGVVVFESDDTWLVSNSAPWLNTTLQEVQEIAGEDLRTADIHQPAGRDFAVTRQRAELTSRQWGITFDHYGAVGEDIIRHIKAASISARQVTVLTGRGDKIEGTISPGQFEQTADVQASGDALLTETSRHPEPADFNLPCGVNLDGSADYVTTADNPSLDPGTSPFTILVCGAFVDAAGDTAISKGNPGVADGYSIGRNAANSLQFVVDGASASGGPAFVSAGWFDGALHVAAGSSSGTGQLLYKDGVAVAAASITHGSIVNAIALTAGAGNGGAGNFMQMTPLRAWAMYLRVLTTDEHLRAANYLLGKPGYRMPAGAVVFYDLADDRCWSGYGTAIRNLASEINEMPATLVSSPPTRGIPWPLEDLDRWT